MNTPGQEGFWQMLRNEFKDLFHTPEELEYRRKQFERTRAELDLSIEQRIHARIRDYEGPHQPNTVFLGSQVLFQLRMQILIKHDTHELEEISEIKIATVYGLKVIEVHSKPHLISVAYIKDI